MPKNQSGRKEQILQTLAEMLESSPGSKITTAKLAANLGVSEAALYRHFPSKTRMYESLIDFVEPEYCPMCGSEITDVDDVDYNDEWDE